MARFQFDTAASGQHHLIILRYRDLEGRLDAALAARPRVDR
jgi:hypothetical protein